MNNNLLKKMFITSAVSMALSACGTGDGDQELYADDLKPVTVNGDLVIDYTETDEFIYIDLLTDVTNPEETEAYGRSFLQVRDEDDEIVFDGAPLPQGVITQSANNIKIDFTLLRDTLVDQRTLDRYPNEETGLERYASGTYYYNYIVDNGADEFVERAATITLRGEEVVAEEINLLTETEFSAPQGYDYNIIAALVPADTTLDRIIYTSSDEAIATVSEDGVVRATGPIGSTFSITLTSEDEQLTQVVNGTVVLLSEPLGVAIVLDDSVPADELQYLSSATIPSAVPVDVDHIFTPIQDDLDFSSFTVTWSSSDTTKLTVDENGTMIGTYDPALEPAEGEEPAEGADTNSAQLTVTVDGLGHEFTSDVEIGPHPNALLNGNWDFSNPWDDNILVRRADTGQTNFADVSIVDNAETIDGPSLYVDSVNSEGPDMRLQFAVDAWIPAALRPSELYQFSFDVKTIEGTPSFWIQNGPIGWTNRQGPSAGTTTRVIFNDIAASKVVSNGFFLNFHSANASRYYVDNVYFGVKRFAPQ